MQNVQEGPSRVLHLGGVLTGSEEGQPVYLSWLSSQEVAWNSPTLRINICLLLRLRGSSLARGIRVQAHIWESWSSWLSV